MTHTENMNRATYLKAAEVVDTWFNNAGRFLNAHPTWTFSHLTKATDELRNAFHAAFGEMYLAGQHPDDYDDQRDVEMSEDAFSLYVEAQWNLADTGI